jgi:putative component of membrane protein insertase Oxa1/YidC/SpoIIIJ protein YidD
MKKIAYLILWVVSVSFAQTDWQKWEAKQVSYLLPTKPGVISTTENESSLLNPLKSIYSFLISDYDGENCPFSPSCADFFVQAAGQTNLFHGILIFADRFTRDINVFKGAGHYALHKNGKYFDPPGNYTLNLHRIKFEPEKD